MDKSAGHLDFLMGAGGRGRVVAFAAAGKRKGSPDRRAARALAADFLEHAQSILAQDAADLLVGVAALDHAAREIR
jgi:hypothetical protein